MGLDESIVGFIMLLSSTFMRDRSFYMYFLLLAPFFVFFCISNRWWTNQVFF